MSPQPMSQGLADHGRTRASATTFRVAVGAQLTSTVAVTARRRTNPRVDCELQAIGALSLAA